MDMGVPGYLPRLSQSAVQYAVLSSAALNCSIADISRFERKHYFYADLPLGYQGKTWLCVCVSFVHCVYVYHRYVTHHQLTLLLLPLFCML